jgi:hypothetical protein
MSYSLITIKQNMLSLTCPGALSPFKVSLTSINEGNYAWGITKKYLCVDGYLSFS